MALKDFIPLIGAIVGGILALGGTFLSYWINRKKEKTHFLRKQLEEIFRLADKTSSNTTLISSMVQAGAESKIPPEFNIASIRSTQNMLIMLTKLYHKSLVEDAESIKTAYKSSEDAIITLVSIGKANQTEYDKQAAILRKKEKAVYDAINNIEYKIEQKIDKYL